MKVYPSEANFSGWKISGVPAIRVSVIAICPNCGEFNDLGYSLLTTPTSGLAPCHTCRTLFIVPKYQQPFIGVSL